MLVPAILPVAEAESPWFLGPWPLFLYVLAGLTLLVMVFRWLAERHVRPLRHGSFQAPLITISVTLAAVLVVLLTVPMPEGEEGLRSTILTTTGVILSAAIALSSTTFLGNLLAGLLLRSLRNFRRGDFVRCGDHFGRVTERGLFHTEIQTEDRDLTTLPNLVLATQPVTVLRESGTIVSATVSLGYDAPRTRVRELLVEAAGEAGLEEPFVRIEDLGDFSITYRVAGLLKEVKTLLTTRSNLRGQMLDHLHQGGIEIVSPNFMNTRALDPRAQVIPPIVRVAEEDDGKEALVFDKAELARSLDDLERVLGDLKAEKAAGQGKLEAKELEELDRRIAYQERLIERRREGMKEKDGPGA